MQIRPYQPADRDQLARIWSAAFRGGKPLEPEVPELHDWSPLFVAEQDGGVIGCFRIHHIEHTLGNSTTQSGGIAAVGVSPEQRQAGTGKQMMRWALRHLHDQGVPFASLFAFSEGYYRSFGYEPVGVRYQIRCASEHLPIEKTNLSGKEISPSDFHLLESCYDQFAKKYNGMIRRNDWWWGRATHANVSDRRVYAFGDPIQAYAIVKFTDDFWVVQPIEEAVWTSPEGYASLLALFKSIGINRSHVSWTEPSDGPFLQSHFDNFSEVSLKRSIMFRVTNFNSAISCFSPKESGSLTIQVHDDLIPENRGPFRIEFSPEAVSVEPSPTAEITLSDRALAQVILGQPSMRDLLRSGAVKASSDAAAIAAIRLFRYRPAYCLDFF